ncbi:MAG: hypothetical protein M0O95_02295 [Clostridiales bacterium]|jgi:hypothetical protein|nr:hypothetical protein [Clostridiales bacterium]MDD2572662.1 hypothetical protein [Eubacteriales bacterium]MDY0119056.1 hypothetical protein [Clostridia bacterium]NLG29642.1 hypothetical protein [Clostridiaceae bacterium]MCK9349857.1 hypothetical protein [Clostridiales bacterium]
MDTFLYILGLVVVALAMVGMVALLQKLQKHKVRMWAKKRPDLDIEDEPEFD